MLFGILDTENSTSILRESLSLVDFSNVEVILPFRSFLRGIFIEIVSKFNYKITEDRTDYLYYLPQKEALKLEKFEDETLKFEPLKKEHTSLVNDLWRAKSRESHLLIERIIEYSPSLGIFDETNELMAWILRYCNCSVIVTVHSLLNHFTLPLEGKTAASVCFMLLKNIGDMATD